MIDFQNIISDIKEKFENYDFNKFLNDIKLLNSILESRLLLPLKYSLNPFELCNPYPNMENLIKNFILHLQFYSAQNLTYGNFFYNIFLDEILIIKKNRNLNITSFVNQLFTYSDFDDSVNELNSDFIPESIPENNTNFNNPDSDFVPESIPENNNNFNNPDSDFVPESIPENNNNFNNPDSDFVPESISISNSTLKMRT